MNKWKRIVVHHSASGYGNAITIDGWHRHRRPVGFTCIGYHYVINNGFNTSADLKSGNIDPEFVGAVEYGRALNNDEWVDFNEIGAHVLGLNQTSIGVCMIHKAKKYSPKVIAALIDLLGTLCSRHKIPIMEIYGHYEFNNKKPHCPGIDMQLIRDILLQCHTI